MKHLNHCREHIFSALFSYIDIMNKKVINIRNLKHNLEYFSSYNKELVIMVKANAYGHGVDNIVASLKKYNVILGVATIDEARRVAKIWKGRILIVEPLKKFDNISKSFQFCIDDYNSFLKAKELNLLENCYIKINTGMNRFGFNYNDKVLKKIGKALKKIKFKGLMTHFSCLEDEKHTNLQYQRLLKVKKYFANVESISLGGTGVCHYSFEYNQLRVGIGFYGYEDNHVFPIMSVKSQILEIRIIEQGEMLGYGNSFAVKGKTKIAVVGIGYGDGLRRDLSGFSVIINEKKCNIVGKICMDCMFVDVSDIQCEKGDEVVIQDAKSSAEYLNTISYEILTSLSSLRGEIEFCDKS